MRGEIYVTYLVVHSPLALGIANERRDAASVHEHILDELRDPQRLKQAGPKFEIIAEAIETALSKRSPLCPFVEAN